MHNREGDLFLTYTDTAKIHTCIRTAKTQGSRTDFAIAVGGEKHIYKFIDTKIKLNWSNVCKMSLHCDYMLHKEKYVEKAYWLEWRETMSGTVWTKLGEWFLFRTNRVTTSLLNAAFQVFFIDCDSKTFLSYIKKWTWTMHCFFLEETHSHLVQHN